MWFAAWARLSVANNAKFSESHYSMSFYKLISLKTAVFIRVLSLNKRKVC
jgi:hypothetical protein